MTVRSVMTGVMWGALALAGGCVSAPKATVFEASGAPERLMDEVRRVMVAEGFDVGEVDPRVGYVRTEWTAVPIGNLTSATHRRYTVLLKRSVGGSDVVVRGEFERCESGTVTREATCTQVDWRTQTCVAEETRPEVVCRSVGVLGDDQQDLDAFAGAVRRALGGAAHGSTPER